MTTYSFKSDCKNMPFFRIRTYRCVNEVQEVLLSLVTVKQGGRLGLHCDPSLSLHLKLVQHLFVLLSLCYGTCACEVDTNMSDHRETQLTTRHINSRLLWCDVPVISSSLSASVLFPWSMWAMMQKFLILSAGNLDKSVVPFKI